jgi:Na+-transporting methylmalonyl-CoA/oxaloacetate decarboxylase gamma subunit
LSIILQGLGLSLAGILITFVYFGLLILVMVLLREIFKAPPQEIKSDKQKKARDIERMKAAGIAVAVAMLKSQKEPGLSLGQVLETPPGRWWRDAGQKGR